MIYSVVPLTPPDTPTDWMVVNGDQHRRMPSYTPGIQSDEPTPQNWLVPLQALVKPVIALLLPPLVWVSPMLSAVNWLREKVSGVAPPRRTLIAPSLFGGGFGNNPIVPLSILEKTRLI